MNLLIFVLRIYEAIIIIRVIFSWVRMDPAHPITQWVYGITEPVLRPIRRVLPTGSIGIDFSPFIVLLAIEVIKRTIFQSPYY